MAGEGMEEIDASAASVSYLSMAQPRGSAVADGTAIVGEFGNTGTGNRYGSSVDVIPVGFKTIWNERDSLGMTVGRYEPDSIEVTETPVPRGKKGFPKKVNPDTGNEVVETFMYALVMPDYPEDGYAVFIPTKASIKACRKWNTLLRASRLPNGTPAPLFGYVWRMVSERVDEGKPTDHVRLGTIKRVGLINKDIFSKIVEPARQIEMSARLAIGAPEDDDSAGVVSTEY
jgi:hypothetical protein